MGEALLDAERAEATGARPEAAKSIAELIAATGGGANAIFDFQHKVFALPGARFATDRHERATMFHIRLGSLNVSLTPMVLRREFNIHVLSHDSLLIELAGHALRHVKEIRPGDSIPHELVDGTASWSIGEHHLALAKARLLAQVVSTFTRDATPPSVEGILGLTDAELSAREDFQKAFARIAQALGIEPERKREIIDQIDAMARELCYIEALRDYAGELRAIQDKIVQLAHIAKGDPAIHEEVARVQALLKPALVEFATRFSSIDAETSDGLALLRNPPRAIRAIRDARDEIHSSLLPWAEVFERWHDQEVVMNHVMDANIHALYAVLAANYAPARIWR